MPLSLSETSPLVTLQKQLDTNYGGSGWARWEPETISMDIAQYFPPVLEDKINFLRVINVAPLQVYEDPGLFLFAAEAINNNAVDFGAIPHLTMLEAAFAIVSINALLAYKGIPVTYPEAIKRTCAYILTQEGASEPMFPFEFVPKEYLTEGQAKSDTEAKKKAIAEYIAHMETQ
jgi:hypothetical protein